jgi:hypothetical protein
MIQSVSSREPTSLTREGMAVERQPIWLPAKKITKGGTWKQSESRRSRTKQDHERQGRKHERSWPR